MTDNAISGNAHRRTVPATNGLVIEVDTANVILFTEVNSAIRCRLLC